MLSAYQQHFCEKAKGQPDPSIEQAKAKVDRAYQIVSQSRIGYSVCAILEHVKHWPSWSTRDDFQKWVGFPATNVSGSREKIERNHDKTTVNFSYSGTPYSLIFIDRGISTWNNDDTTAYALDVLRFIAFFHKAGVGLREIRAIMHEVRDTLNRPHPFATRAVFRTDGIKIVAEIGRKNGVEIYDLRSKNFEMRTKSVGKVGMLTPSGRLTCKGGTRNAIAAAPTRTLPRLFIIPGLPAVGPKPHPVPASVSV